MADLGGAQGARAPPGHPNSFDFMQFSGNFGKIVCWRPPPPGELAPPPFPGEILDPPLGRDIKILFELIFLKSA